MILWFQKFSAFFSCKLPWILVYEASDNVFKYVDHFDDPGRTVQYQLIAINRAGYGVSETKQVQLPIESPFEMPTVHAQTLSATSVQADWSFGDDYSMIDRFRYDVIIQKDSGEDAIGSTTTVSTPRRSRRSTDQGAKSIAFVNFLCLLM